MQLFRNSFARLTLSMLVLFSGSAFGDILCQYAAYTPESIQFFLSQEYRNAGFAVAPTSFFVGSTANTGEVMLARNSKQYGYMSFTSDTRRGVKALAILDSARKVIARAEETTAVCGLGICRESRLSIEINGRPSVIGLVDDPAYGISYFIGSQIPHNSVDTVLWRSQLNEHIQWINTLLLDDARSVVMTAPIPQARLALALGTNPMIAPYLAYLSIYPDADNHLVISGTTNYNIYSMIINTALSHGFYNIRPLVRIDSGFVIPEPQPPFDLSRCL